MTEKELADWMVKRKGLEWWEDRPEFGTGGIFKQKPQVMRYARAAGGGE